MLTFALVCVNNIMFLQGRPIYVIKSLVYTVENFRETEYHKNVRVETILKE